MTKCMICEKWRPDEFTSQLVTNEGNIMTDPECARKRIGEIHGISNYKFGGSEVRRIHKKYMKWLKREEKKNE